MIRTNAAAPGVGTEGRRRNDLGDHVNHTVSDPDSPAERALLGARLWCSAEDGAAADALVADADIADPLLRDLYGVIRRMASEDLPVDPSTVPAYARSHGLIERGPNLTMLASRVAELAVNAPPGCTVSFHARIVAEQGVRRRAVDLLGSLAVFFQRADRDLLAAELERVSQVLRIDLGRIGGDRDVT